MLCNPSKPTSSPRQPPFNLIKPYSAPSPKLPDQKPKEYYPNPQIASTTAALNPNPKTLNHKPSTHSLEILTLN